MQDLDRATLYKAMLARDKRFDGRFYIGVRTTGIYCRPVCPARPKLKNIAFYRSQAEAEGAGFRPCLRCRPDLSPSAPLWQGTAAVVGRALRMINEGQADGLSLKDFASKLGVTDRHLRRLFGEHVGAAPVEVAISKRLHLARLLLSQTQLPVTEIAFASGFQSIRRFNTAFRQKYARSPRDFRKSAKLPRTGLCLELPVLPPFDWDYLYSFLQRHRIAGVERFLDGRYERLLGGKRPGLLTVEFTPEKNLLLVRIDGTEINEIRGLLARVRHLFDLDHNPSTTNGKARPRSLGGVRVPGAFSGFETAIGVILGQLVSVDAARAKMQKLVELFGSEIKSPYPGLSRAFPSPETLATADLTLLGIPRARSEAIRELSRQVSMGELTLDRTAPLEATRMRLAQIKGVGPWTVEMIAMRCLADPDAFPAGDLIIARAVNLLKLDFGKWKPWRSYLSLWIWKNYADKLSQKGKKKNEL